MADLSHSRPGVPQRAPGFLFRALRALERLTASAYATACPICRTYVSAQSEWPLCAECQARVDLLGGPRCKRCGRPEHDNGLCDDCIQGRSPENPLYTLSVAAYGGPVRDLIHAIKFKGRDELAAPLTQALMVRYVECHERFGPFNALVPVPLFPERLMMRGFNLPDVWCRRLALAYGGRYRPGWLVRVRNTPSQVGLDLEKRLTNVQSAFECPKPQRVNGRRILLVDDVATSGATMTAAAAPLKAAGALVVGLSLARTLKV
jgi:ComF family protein